MELHSEKLHIDFQLLAQSVASMLSKQENLDIRISKVENSQKEVEVILSSDNPRDLARIIESIKLDVAKNALENKHQIAQLDNKTLIGGGGLLVILNNLLEQGITRLLGS